MKVARDDVPTSPDAPKTASEAPKAVHRDPTAPQVLVPEGLSGVQVQAAFQLWQSAYPPPEAAERFERLCPGAFERMLKMAEQAQKDQTASIEKLNERQSADNKRGAWFGFSITVLAMFGAAFSVLNNQPWVASVFLGLPVLAVAKSFIGSSGRAMTDNTRSANQSGDGNKKL